MQLKGSIFYKFGAIFATFVAMPIMIKYLGVEQFGVWSTMLTLVNWVMLFDLGIGNGLKNKILEGLAKNEGKEVVSYISTAYVLIGLVSFVFFAFFAFASFHISWREVFNSASMSEGELRYSVIILSFFVFFNFWMSLVNQVYHGLQMSSFVALGQFLSNGLALLFVALLYRFCGASLIKMVLVYGSALVISNGALSFFIFKSNAEVRPSIAGFDTRKISPLLSLGGKFFVIQISMLLIFMTDKIIITQLLGPKQVTPYDVVFKLFSVFTIFHSLILLPIWSAYSNAYAQGDFVWIRDALKKQIKIAFFIFLGAGFMAFIGPFIVRVWVGKNLEVSNSLYLFFWGFVGVSVWSNVFAYFVNAVNEINLQIVTSVVAAIINVPMSIYFVSYLGLGLGGVVLATTLSLSIFGLVGPVQVLNIIRHRL
ncbi:oligosaccharide flippase family protein [Mangrovitalea sediminis]|uniref:oligosaccharide flippase family protein n=1 Tax=Mangrovitalea sediminis TaxID=1982043 RepID=UPI0011784BA0|nr:oligosaccharide flippase family protein [Mangrovitalea sediminis]